MKTENGYKPDRLLKRADVAERLHVCIRTVIRLERAGKLKPVPGVSPRLIFHRESDVARLIAGETV
jgi:predicted site-specific integrase-resolvase